MSANPNVRTTRCACGSLECGTYCLMIEAMEGPDYGKDDEWHEPARSGWEPTVDQVLDNPHRGAV